MKKLFFFFLLIFSEQAWGGYSRSYIPKEYPPTIYKILYQRREKCTLGEKKEYPKQIGACISCPENTIYLIDDVQNKAFCLKCPKGSILAKRDGYPMCLASYPVIDGKIQTPEGEIPSEENLKHKAKQLSADYKISLQNFPEKNKDKFNNKEKLTNICPSSYPEDETAQKQIDICRRLVNQNDFLCPYVEKNAEGKWICRACPKNAPYKNEQGGCFNCPYGEEMVSLENGTLVCASEAALIKKKKKKKIVPKKVIQKKKK